MFALVAAALFVLATDTLAASAETRAETGCGGQATDQFLILIKWRRSGAFDNCAGWSQSRGAGV